MPEIVTTTREEMANFKEEIIAEVKADVLSQTVSRKLSDEVLKLKKDLNQFCKEVCADHTPIKAATLQDGIYRIIKVGFHIREINSLTDDQAKEAEVLFHSIKEWIMANHTSKEGSIA